MKLFILFLLLAGDLVAAVTPAQYLATQTPPVFRSGTILPHLSRWSWPLSYALSVELATNWGYALPIETSYINGGFAADMANSASDTYKEIFLSTNYPTHFWLQLYVDRSQPTNMSNGFWVTNSDGWFTDNSTNAWQYATNANFTKIASPEAPQADLTIQAASIAAPLASIAAIGHVGIILNGGERDLGVAGNDQKAWSFDSRSLTARGANSWADYSSQRKGIQLTNVTMAIRAAIPNRELYIFYNTANEENRLTALADWWNVYDAWGWRSDYLLGTNLTLPRNSDMASFEDYFLDDGSWTNRGVAFNYDLLTKHLNALGYSFTIGYTNNYTWVSGGWTSVTNLARLADIPRYKGFLKCLYTSGTVGCVAGYFDYPVGGFDAAFEPSTPPHWLLQMIALSRVHAQFTYLDDYLTAGQLLAGNNSSIMVNDQPAYEFTNTVADVRVRVLARKLYASNNWLVCAWAANGQDRNVTVNIPTLGAVTVYARDEGSVYKMTTTSREWVDGPPPTVSATFGTFTIKQ